MLLYYRLMTKWSGLGDSTQLSRVGLSQMAYRERGSGPPHFDGKNYQMWSKRMASFLRGKGQVLWDVTVDTGYVQPMNFLAEGSRDMFDANNKASTTCFVLCVSLSSIGCTPSTWLVESGWCCRMSHPIFRRKTKCYYMYAMI
jgi:hypothetical protein